MYFITIFLTNERGKGGREGQSVSPNNSFKKVYSKLKRNGGISRRTSEQRVLVVGFFGFLFF